MIFLVRLFTASRLAEVPPWKLMIGGAALMFVGQIFLVFIEWGVFGKPSEHLDPFPRLSPEFQAILAVMVAPFIETIVGQWLPIRLIHRQFGQPWWISGVASMIVFTGLHGYTDRRAVNIFFGALVLATVFTVEAKRNGRPILTTSLTHALANGLVVALHFISKAV